MLSLNLGAVLLRLVLSAMLVNVTSICVGLQSFQLFWCGSLCKDFFTEAKYLLLSDNIPLMGCTCVYTSLYTKTVNDLRCLCFEVFMYIIAFHVYNCFCVFIQQLNISKVF